MIDYRKNENTHTHRREIQIDMPNIIAYTEIGVTTPAFATIAKDCRISARIQELVDDFIYNNVNIRDAELYLIQEVIFACALTGLELQIKNSKQQQQNEINSESWRKWQI